MMLELNNVTLCSVDTRTPELALWALQRSMVQVRYADAVLFSQYSDSLSERAAAVGVRLVGIEPLRSIRDYSVFMLRTLNSFIDSDYALVTQWDGFVLNPACWSEEYLRFDYVGALWADVQPGFEVGNGGFSLRSKRLLMALQDQDMKIENPEDACICLLNRSLLETRYGIRFAPADVAAMFSYEHVSTGSATFGFHGTFNLVDALNESEMKQLAIELPLEMAFSAGMRRLIKRLIYSQQYEAASIILKKRFASGDWRWRVRSLWLRMQVRRLCHNFGLLKRPAK